MQPPMETAEHPRRVFVDTQGWAEVFHAGGLHHTQAVALMQEAHTAHWELITPNLILSELTPLFRSHNIRLPQPQILAIIAQIRALPNLTIVHVDPLLDQQAWDLLDANPQHPWSHVDATRDDHHAADWRRRDTDGGPSLRAGWLHHSAVGV